MSRGTLFLMFLLLMACSDHKKNITKHETVKADWNEMTDSIKSFKNSFNSYVRSNNAEISKMMIPQDSIDSLGETGDVWIEKVTDLMTVSGSFGPLIYDFSEFEKLWEKQTEEFEDLNNAISEGTFNGSLERTLEKFENLISSGNENLNGWKTRYESIKTNFEQALSDLEDLRNSILSE